VTKCPSPGTVAGRTLREIKPLLVARSLPFLSGDLTPESAVVAASPYRVLLAAAALTGCTQWTVLPDDEPLPPPATLSSTSLDGAIALRWADTPYQASPSRFLRYLVYSAPYDLDADLCLAQWRLEGTTVAAEFIAGALTNGAPRCFTITAETQGGLESTRSPMRFDTPRFEATAVALSAAQVDAGQAGFRFWRDQNGDGGASRSELGRVGSALGDIDFRVDRDGAGRLFLTPVRSGVEIALYGNQPITRLEDIDLAPVTGYAPSGIEAVAGWGYVVRMRGPDGFQRFGGVRVAYVGSNYLLLDWSFQSDPGNPELLRAPE